MTKPFTLHLGDCIEVMKTLPDNSVDAVVTDPPYELGFMGKKWDASGIAYRVDMWAEALRVLKPGGHLLAFSGSRTYHRMTCAIEDAGFEVRDQIMWLYSQGFPKSNNLDNLRGEKFCGCTTGALQYSHEKNRQTQDQEGDAQLHMHGMREAVSPRGVSAGEGQDAELQQAMQREAARRGVGATRAQGAAARKTFTKLFGSDNPAWKGGVTIFKKKGNYASIRYLRAPEWALPMARKDGYLMEHRLVMAIWCGYLLTRTEVVHHVDHNPLNNASNNLELWPTNQAHKLWEHGRFVPDAVCRWYPKD